MPVVGTAAPEMVGLPDVQDICQVPGRSGDWDTSLLCLWAICPEYFAFPENRSTQERGIMGFQNHWELCQGALLPAVLHSLCMLACALPWWPCQGALGRKLKLTDVNNKGGSSGHDQLRDMARGAGHRVELQSGDACGFALRQTFHLYATR